MLLSCLNILAEYCSIAHSNMFSFLQAAHMQEALEESVQMMKEAVDDLGATLAEAASAAGAVGGMVDSINDAINKMEDSPALEPEGTFVDYQTTMVKTAKAIAVTVQEMVRHCDDHPTGRSMIKLNFLSSCSLGCSLHDFKTAKGLLGTTTTYTCLHFMI